ncbi:hypothetical protein PR048_001682 [Dryococelus australis]|uniref:Uncharacterized protein n=1 Tax=Dryococelus australis TaxID=614101 RepID=A0ABQ9II18_9NEOP|nr:hypothetical protein PR048_001682 [Dryococelus australis]
MGSWFPIMESINDGRTARRAPIQRLARISDMALKACVIVALIAVPRNRVVYFVLNTVVVRQHNLDFGRLRRFPPPFPLQQETNRAGKLTALGQSRDSVLRLNMYTLGAGFFKQVSAISQPCTVPVNGRPACRFNCGTQCSSNVVRVCERAPVRPQLRAPSVLSLFWALCDELRQPERILSDVIMTWSLEREHERAISGPIGVPLSKTSMTLSYLPLALECPKTSQMQNKTWMRVCRS